MRLNNFRIDLNIICSTCKNLSNNIGMVIKCDVCRLLELNQQNIFEDKHLFVRKVVFKTFDIKVLVVIKSLCDDGIIIQRQSLQADVFEHPRLAHFILMKR